MGAAPQQLVVRVEAGLKVTIGDDELVLSGVSQEDQRRLIDDWLARRAPEPGAHG